MSYFVEFFRSPMGKKAVMAVTGIMLFGFVFTHMLGNLKLYMGPEALDAYAEGLRHLGKPIFAENQVLWLMRSGLIAAVVLHILSAYQVTQLSRRARPEAYAKQRLQKATYASRTMRWGGVIILLFIVYHLLQLTFGFAHSDYPEFDRHQVYHNVVAAFSNPWVVAFYILAQVALGLHLRHGMWSLFQSLGVSGGKFDVFRQYFATGFALVVSLVNISFPIAVVSGLVGGA